jgi:hypothetical protein
VTLGGVFECRVKQTTVRKILLSSLMLLSCVAAKAQTTYLPLRSEEYNLLDRLETISGDLSNDFYSSLKPIPRKGAVDFLLKQRQRGKLSPNNLSKVDMYDINRALSISGEWSTTAEGDDGAIPSLRPILKYFYQKQPDLVHVNTGDFFLAVNPVLYLQAGKESNVDGAKYINTRGVEIRGKIFNRVGFYTMLADNQEKTVSYINSWTTRYQAFPGNDNYSTTGSGAYDAFIARGYVDVGAFNDRFNVTFGYDKNFSGDGLRSLQISDFGAAATFLRLRTRIWKLMYENLYLELTPHFQKLGDGLLPHKYATINQVSMNVRPWLNVGIFESTMFSKPDRFGVEYLMPVIFYNTLARSLGADQKTSLGLNFKAIALNHLQFYGQAYFDGLKVSEPGNWANQWGLQLGAKYFNAFTVSNLDIQGEMNMVRPFTYASNDGISDYSHYNQPLAHPYGAGFVELIGTVRYQPLNKLYLSAKAIYSARSEDEIASVNYGSDIFKTYDTRSADNNLSWVPGQRGKSIYLNLNAAYELRPNIFLEAGISHLNRNGYILVATNPSTYFYGGLRWNISRKEYDTY